MDWVYSMYIPLPLKGAVWIEKTTTAYASWLKPDVVKEGGEYLVWWGRLHAILTPPGWKPLKVPLKGYEPA